MGTTESLRSRYGGTIDKDALERTMRLLCAAGALEQCSGDGVEECFKLTNVGALLQTDGLPSHQPSLACAVESWTDPRKLRAWAALPELVLGRCEGASAYEQANGGSVAEHLRGDHAYGEFVRFVGGRARSEDR